MCVREHASDFEASAEIAGALVDGEFDHHCLLMGLQAL
jgi:hypothetical protein